MLLAKENELRQREAPLQFVSVKRWFTCETITGAYPSLPPAQDRGPPAKRDRFENTALRIVPHPLLEASKDNKPQATQIIELK
jgi:hypothetical protein